MPDLNFKPLLPYQSTVGTELLLDAIPTRLPNEIPLPFTNINRQLYQFDDLPIVDRSLRIEDLQLNPEQEVVFERIKTVQSTLPGVKFLILLAGPGKGKSRLIKRLTLYFRELGIEVDIRCPSWSSAFEVNGLTLQSLTCTMLGSVKVEYL